MTAPDTFARTGLLRTLSDELDPPLERRALARTRYDDLGSYLTEHARTTGNRAVRVYPQGSASIGTTTQHPETGEFDVDVVLSVGYGKTEISQRDLNAIVNGWLGSYTAARKAGGGHVAPTSLEKGKRAWTLTYADDFHMDVLPVVPDSRSVIRSLAGDPSWLTDKELRRWQPTNPEGYAEWFQKASASERIEKRLLAVQVDDLPYHSAKTSLQRLVQILKRHRDHVFRDNPEVAPPSVVITALVERAYRAVTPHGGTLDFIAPRVLAAMPKGIDYVNGEISVTNPTCPGENYADRFKGQPLKLKALTDWIQAAQRDFDSVLTSTGLPTITKSMNDAFGAELGGKVATHLGHQTTAARRSGALASGTTGTLSVATGAGRTHKDHTFYGIEDS